MKYYVEYPAPIKCNLKCDYCFSAEAWELEREGKYNTKYSDTCPFTPKQFLVWRDKHLTDATGFLYELHGGEISYPSSQSVVLEIIDTLDKGKWQLQSNGTGNADFYRELIVRKDKIERIGLTYHRKHLTDENLINRFMETATLLKDSGINVYIKELLLLEYKQQILESKQFWKDKGYEYRLQDFKGYRGRDSGEMLKYTAEDWSLIYPEYKHEGTTCHCREGYKQILIRGYDCFSGGVLGCWQSLSEIGNILTDTYTGYEQVNILPNGGRNIVVGKKVYRGSYPYDFWRPNIEKEYQSLNINQLKNPIYKEVIMTARFQERLEEINAKRQNVGAEVSQIHQLMTNCEAHLKELNIEDAKLIGKIEMLQEVMENIDHEPEAELVKETKND